MEGRARSWAKEGEIKFSVNRLQDSWKEISVATERQK